jgi:hypothetical protein
LGFVLVLLFFFLFGVGGDAGSGGQLPHGGGTPCFLMVLVAMQVQVDNFAREIRELLAEKSLLHTLLGKQDETLKALAKASKLEVAGLKEQLAAKDAQLGLATEHIARCVDELLGDRNAELNTTEKALVVHRVMERPKPVDIILKLGLDFSSAGSDGSQERKEFERELAQNLSHASGLPPAHFKVKHMSPGSIIVDTEINSDVTGNFPDPKSVAMDLERQVRDVYSRLRSGTITRFAQSITIPGLQPTPTAQTNACKHIVDRPHATENEQSREEPNMNRDEARDGLGRPSQSREEPNLNRDEARAGYRQPSKQPVHHPVLPQREEHSRALDEQQRKTMMILDLAYSAMETLLHAAEDTVAAGDVNRADRLRRLSAQLEKHTLKWAQKWENVENNDGSDNDDPHIVVQPPSRYDFVGGQEDLSVVVTVEEVHPSPPPNLVELEQGNRRREAELELEMELELFEDLVAAAREIESLAAENKALYAKMALMKTNMNLIQGHNRAGIGSGEQSHDHADTIEQELAAANNLTIMPSNLKIIRQGWLLKQNPNGVLLKMWKKRYFKLTETALLYAESEQLAALREVPLNIISSVERSDRVKGRDNCFTVSTYLFCENGKRRIYLLQVERVIGHVGLH